MYSTKEKLAVIFFVIFAGVFISIGWIAMFFNLKGQDIHDVIQAIKKL